MATLDQGDELVGSIELGGFTRSERCYTSKKVKRWRKRKGNKGDEIIKLGRKALVQKGLKKNKLVTKEKAEEFGKVVKHGECSIVK